MEANLSTRINRGAVLGGEANTTARGRLLQHRERGTLQVDLRFALWTSSRGAWRETALVTKILPPGRKDRDSQGNAGFSGNLLARATLDAVRRSSESTNFRIGASIALAPGW